MSADDFAGVILVVILLVICIFVGGCMGYPLGEGDAYHAICERSGYDGYEEINDVHYCYTQNSDGAVFVEVLVCDN